MLSLESDTHLILVDTYRNKNDIIEDLENENYLLYKVTTEVGNYGHYQYQCEL